MARIFNGIARLHRGIMGDLVTIHPLGQPSKAIKAIFRVHPLDLESDIASDDLAVREVGPVLRAGIADVADLKDGDLIDAPNGKSYRCRPRQVEASPDEDASITIPLELIGD